MTDSKEDYQNEMDDVMSELNIKTKLFMDKLKKRSKSPRIDM